MLHRLAVPASVLILALVGCGGGGGDGAAPTAPAAPATPSAPAPTVLKSGIQLVAGDPGTGGVYDRTGDATALGGLAAITSDAAGNIFVAETGGIRKITPQRVVTTLAPVSASGMVVDPAGTLFFTQGTFLKKVTPDGVVSTVQGAAPPPSTTCGCPPIDDPSPPVDGDKATARFRALGAITRDKAGNFYVADWETLRRISPAGDVVTVAGSPGFGPHGPLTTSLFLHVGGLAVDAGGNVYLTDTGHSVIRKITPAGVVTTFAGTVGVAGTADGTGPAARFTSPQAITIDDAGTLYVTDHVLNVGPRVRKITAAGVVSTLSTPPPQMFVNDGGITHDPAGNLYVTHYTIIERITPAGVREPWVGSRAPENQVPLDGTGSGALFAGARRVAADAQGNAHVMDGQDGTYLRRVTADGKVTTVAGGPEHDVAMDGTGSAAHFLSINAVATDAAGWDYVADAHAVRKVSPAGVVTTIAGALGWDGYGYVDGPAAQARFSSLSGITLDRDGIIYVADLLNHVVRKITPAGEVSTLAGAPGQQGFADGKGADARFQVLEGMFVDAAGNVYVNDLGHGLRKIAPDGTVSTVPGTAGNATRWAAVDAAGNFYGLDMHVVNKLTPAGVLSTVAGTPGLDQIALGDLPGSVGFASTLALLPPLPNTIGTRLLVMNNRALLLVTLSE